MSESTAALDNTAGVSAQVLPNSPQTAPTGERAKGGQFELGNTAAWKHGLRSQRVLVPGQFPAHTADLLREREAAIVADMGGPEVLSALAGGQVCRHARLELVEGTLWANLEAKGMLTGKGATRAATTLWLQVLDRLQKSALSLGLARKPKPVGTLGAHLSETYGERPA
jgi:hypothetical protein